MALFLMRIAFPVPEAYTVTDKHILIDNHETQTHDPEAVSSYSRILPPGLGKHLISVTLNWPMPARLTARPVMKVPTISSTWHTSW